MTPHLTSVPCFNPDPTLPRHPSTIAPTPGELAAVLAYEYNDLLNLAGVAVKAEVADEMMACTDSYVVLRHLAAVRAVADRLGAAS